MFFLLSQVWNKGKIPSPHEEWTLRPWDSVLQCSTTEPQILYDKQGHWEAQQAQNLPSF